MRRSETNMRKTFKRSLALVLSLLMLMTAVPMSFAATTCPNCHERVEAEIHDAVGATCSSFGYTKAGSYCPNCGHCFSDDEGKRLDKTEHNDSNLEKKDMEPASCEANGKIEHYQCKDCHKFFVKNGSKYVEVTETALTLYGHDFKAITADDITLTPKENNETGYTATITLTCSNNECEPVTLAAELDDGEAVTHATCAADGKTKYTATVKVNVWVNGAVTEVTYSGTKEVVIPKLDHKDQYVKHEQKNGNCVATGNIEYYSCATCNILFTKNEDGTYTKVEEEDVITPKLEGFDAHTVEGEPQKFSGTLENQEEFDCIKGGIWVATCANCHEEYVYGEIPAVDSHTEQDFPAVPRKYLCGCFYRA